MNSIKSVIIWLVLSSWFTWRYFLDAWNINTLHTFLARSTVLSSVFGTSFLVEDCYTYWSSKYSIVCVYSGSMITQGNRFICNAACIRVVMSDIFLSFIPIFYTKIWSLIPKAGAFWSLIAWSRSLAVIPDSGWFWICDLRSQACGPWSHIPRYEPMMTMLEKIILHGLSEQRAFVVREK